MNILVMNGSPKGERSDTIRLTRAFIEGIKEVEDNCSVEIIDTMKQRMNPCLGCYSCWWKTPGKCVQNDGMDKVLEKLRLSDLVIWSFPLYFYGFPSNLKNYIDRMLPFSTNVQETDEDGNTYHPVRDEHRSVNIMISGCGFPDIEGNFDGTIFSFRKIFGDAPIITCMESPMLNIPDAKPLADMYLANVKKAGAEFAKDGIISAATKAELDKPMLDPDEYRRICSGN